MPRIRVAKLSDTRNLAELAEITFRDTFTAQNTVENMGFHCRSSFGEVIQGREISSPDYETLVVEEHDRLVAFAQLRSGKPPKCVLANSPGEIHRLYVKKSWHGKGLAQQLMLACLDKMKARDTDIAWLGVWEKNPRAISFYRKFNFKEVGGHEFPLGKDPQRDIIMVRKVNSSRPTT